jgi:hypothetical protein
MSKSLTATSPPEQPTGRSEDQNPVDVRIGIVQTVKELEVELGDQVEREDVISEIEGALSKPDGVLWLTDRRGRRVAIPVNKVAYIEVGAPVSDRRVGFGAP